jgi:hypothetical protein
MPDAYYYNGPDDRDARTRLDSDRTDRTRETTPDKPTPGTEAEGREKLERLREALANLHRTAQRKDRLRR